jgi:hypothetical protein
MCVSAEKRWIMAGKNCLSAPERHQLAIARKTLKMPDEIVGVMGYPDKKQAREIISRLGKKCRR